MATGHMEQVYTHYLSNQPYLVLPAYSLVLFELHHSLNFPQLEQAQPRGHCAIEDTAQCHPRPPPPQ